MKLSIYHYRQTPKYIFLCSYKTKIFISMKTPIITLFSFLLVSLIVSCKPKDIDPINDPKPDTTQVDNGYLKDKDVFVYNEQNLTYTYNQDYKVRKSMVDSHMVDLFYHLKNGLNTITTTHYVNAEVSITDYTDENNFTISNTVKIARSYHNGDKDYSLKYDYEVKDGVMVMKEHNDLYPTHIIHDSSNRDIWRPADNPLKIRFNNTVLYHIEMFTSGSNEYRISVDLVALKDSSTYKNNTNGIERLVLTLENGKKVSPRYWAPVDDQQGGYVEFVFDNPAREISEGLILFKVKSITLNSITYPLTERQHKYFKRVNYVWE
ncbi:MAG: hypothetical protein BGO09_03460 [Bacteroidetes bacterium 47-18]|nr:MAG: hypothetical protein BGO09_03460 [Bacteroidetes bacterium 47-18]